jgi:hypothetical protein
VDHDVRVERRDHVDGAVVLPRHDAVEHGAMQTSARRIGVDTLERCDPRLIFEQTGDP